MFSLIDMPGYVAEDDYKAAIARMTKLLSGIPGVVTVYQTGSVSAPGISDIDMVVVFRDGVGCAFDPRLKLPRGLLYLFAHSLYGLSESAFREGRRYEFLTRYELLWGEEQDLGPQGTTDTEREQLHAQTALEYLLKMYIDLFIQITYRIIKVRALLLHAKALELDLGLLGISSGKVREMICGAVEWREQWFASMPGKKAVVEWALEFFSALGKLLAAELESRKFYLPDPAGLELAANAWIRPSEALSVSHRGRPLHPFPGFLGRRYFNLQHRFNRFTLFAPFESGAVPGVIADRFRYLKDTACMGEELLPGFMPFTSGLGRV